MSTDAVLLAMQAPSGTPRGTFFSTITDPLLPPSSISEMLAHFHPDVYDLSDESHLSRLLKTLLGDAGTGQLRKRYTYAHLSQFILTTHYNDLDQLYAEIFGLKRFLRERLSIDPYTEAATDEEWAAIDAADASYRNRIEAFSHAIALAGTPSGMAIAAQAVLGEECRVYESYGFLEDALVYEGSQAAQTYTYGDLEGQGTYAALEGQTYAALEGSSGSQGRVTSTRGEFIVRPLRTVTAEERYHLTTVLSRLKPAEALLTIDDRPTTLHVPVPVHRAASDSTYWNVQAQVQITESTKDLYQRYAANAPIQQPKPAFAQYQGEGWDYNADVVTTASSAEDAEGTTVQSINFERLVTVEGQVYDYPPGNALTDPVKSLMGRVVNDGVLVSSPVTRGGDQ